MNIAKIMSNPRRRAQQHVTVTWQLAALPLVQTIFNTRRWLVRKAERQRLFAHPITSQNVVLNITTRCV